MSSFLFIVMLNILVSSCQTLDSTEKEKGKQAEILTTQKTLVVSFLNRGLPNLAYKELRKLLQEYPSDTDFKNLMGLTYLALNNPKQAIPYFADAYKTDKKPSVALNLSSAYIETKQYDRAISMLNQLEKSGAMKGYAYPERVAHNIGLAHERSNRLKQAERFYRKALDINPNYYISQMKLGQLYERTRRTKDAHHSYTLATRICTQCFDPINALAEQYAKSNQHDKAVATVTEFLKTPELDSNEKTRAQQYLGQLRARMAKSSINTAPTKSLRKN